MRTSIINAAHTESESLGKTVRSVVESTARLDYEIVISDDASFDGSVEDAARRFPQVRVVRHEERQGASPAKHQGAKQARGEALVFLDGHTKPESGAIERLVEDVQWLKGSAIITPAVPALDCARWKNSATQVGHGYRLELEQLDCGWLPLGAMKQARERGREFYESPALIGCALALSRELYDELWGFDAHMLSWGVEDLDFGLKCWLMGHRVLHDPQAVVGHRFRERFDNFDVPPERLIVNQLRLARKNFAPAVWNQWVERCRKRHAGRLADHPEGLWARAWSLFEADLASADEERAYLHARRVRDEFWYAERFGLSWPKLQSEPRVLVSTADDPEPSPSPSPPPCSITGIDPAEAKICAGVDKKFTALGVGLDDASWSTFLIGVPPTGMGREFTTKWLTPGFLRKVKVECGETSAVANVTVVGVSEVFVAGTDPHDHGPKAIRVGTAITLEAWSDPVNAGFAGTGGPTWTIVEQPEGSTVPNPPPGVATATITPTHPGEYLIEASCGTSKKSFVLTGARVTFNSQPYPPAGEPLFPAGTIVTGFTLPLNTSIIKNSLTATVEPDSEVENVVFTTGGDVPARAKVTVTNRLANGTVFLNVEGLSATAANRPNGDTTAIATLGGVVCGQAPVVVIVPRTVQGVNANGIVTGVNMLGDKGSSPVYVPTLPPNTVHLWTIYGHFLQIPVLNQFLEPLGPLYEGTPVTERADQKPINQNVTALGTYADPVGATMDRVGGADFLRTSQQAIDWPTDPQVVLPTATLDPQNIIVHIGGHHLTPGIVNRRIITTANDATSGNVEIIWSQ